MKCSIGKLLQAVRFSSDLCKSNENLASEQMNQRKPMEIKAEWKMEYVACLVNTGQYQKLRVSFMTQGIHQRKLMDPDSRIRMFRSWLEDQYLYMQRLSRSSVTPWVSGPCAPGRKSVILVCQM